jgi:hypothetical protein
VAGNPLPRARHDASVVPATIAVMVEMDGCIFLDAGQHMDVGVEGDAHSRVAKTPADHLGMDAQAHKMGGVTMAQIMESRMRGRSSDRISSVNATVTWAGSSGVPGRRAQTRSLFL